MATTDIRNTRNEERANNALWAILALVVLALAVFAWFSYGNMDEDYTTTTTMGSADTTGTVNETVPTDSENVNPATGY